MIRTFIRSNLGKNVQNFHILVKSSDIEYQSEGMNQYFAYNFCGIKYMLLWGFLVYDVKIHFTAHAEVLITWKGNGDVHMDLLQKRLWF